MPSAAKIATEYTPVHQSIERLVNDWSSGNKVARLHKRTLWFNGFIANKTSKYFNGQVLWNMREKESEGMRITKLTGGV
jgi:hypothetical protein